jgi:protein ImuB
VAKRIACVDLPALPLQVLRREHPAWEGLPVAVVARDEPHAPVTWVSAAAQELGVRAGMRYVAALAISRELRAAPVAPHRVEDLRAELVGALLRFTPRVEPDRARPGTIWLDPDGMLSLFGTLDRWARAIATEMEARRWVASVVVGHARLPTWAIARGLSRARPSSRGAHEPVRVLASEEDERALAARVPLGCLDLPVELADALFVMGVRTLGELLAIPRGEISVRFGREAARLCAELAGSWDAPFEAARDEAPIEIEAEVDPPDDDESRLLFCMRGALHVIMGSLAERQMALGALHVRLESEPGLHLEKGPVHEEVLRPARACRDVASVTELLRLRLGALVADGRLGGARQGRGLDRRAGSREATSGASTSTAADRVGRIQRIVLRAEPAPLDTTQLVLATSEHGARRSRDPEALTRGIARLRAAFGDDAVTVPRLEDSWVPERSFRWEPIERMPRAEPPSREARRRAPRARTSEGAERASDDASARFWSPTLVRRILSPPEPLPPGPGGGPRLDPPLRSLSGPYRLQSGWWAREGADADTSGLVTRDYFYAEREDGALLWIFRDPARERWFLQGIVD